MAGALRGSGLTCVTVAALSNTILGCPFARTLVLIILIVLGIG